MRGIAHHVTTVIHNLEILRMNSKFLQLFLPVCTEIIEHFESEIF